MLTKHHTQKSVLKVAVTRASVRRSGEYQKTLKVIIRARGCAKGFAPAQVSDASVKTSGRKCSVGAPVRPNARNRKKQAERRVLIQSFMLMKESLSR